MKVKIEFSESVQEHNCSVNINGVSWVKTGPRSGEVSGLELGRAACGWWVAGDAGESYTITLSGAKWNWPTPKAATKTKPFLKDATGYGVAGIHVEEQGGV